MSKKNIEYVIKEEFKMNKDLTEEQKKEIFNKKLFEVILKLEKNTLGDTYNNET